MWKLAALWMACAIAWGAEASWQKVKDLKIGSDIRVFRKDATMPVSGKSGGVTDDKLIIMIKKHQVSIDKADIDHIDYHPSWKAEKTESHSVVTEGTGTTETYSSGTSFSRGSWQTVYQK